jgi:hypothetical protein
MLTMPCRLSKALQAKTGEQLEHAEFSKTPPMNSNLPLLPAVQLNTDLTTVTTTVTPGMNNLMRLTQTQGSNRRRKCPLPPKKVGVLPQTKLDS